MHMFEFVTHLRGEVTIYYIVSGEEAFTTLCPGRKHLLHCVRGGSIYLQVLQKLFQVDNSGVGRPD